MKYYFIPSIEINVIFSNEEFELLNEAILNSEYKFDAEDPSGWWFKLCHYRTVFKGSDYVPIAITFRNLDTLTKCLEKRCTSYDKKCNLALLTTSKIGTILRACNAKSEELNELFTGDIAEL